MESQPKQYTFLKTVQGSHDGLTTRTFGMGETHALADDLAEQFYHLGAIDAVGGTPADRRAKKVTGPTETKEGEAGVDLDTQNVEELVALARDTYGLEVDTTMSVEDVKALIERAQGDDQPDVAKMTKKELVAHAATLGLELDESSKKDEMLDAIEAHTAA